LNQILILQPQKDDLLQQKFSKKQQWELGKEISKKLGFCFDNGRKDLSTHPFTISMAANDVRITTRIDENNFMEMLWSTIHEVGHALYEQGLSKDDYGLPGGEACSISIHESQSRFYENNLGKSADFLSYIWPGLQKKFSKQLNGCSIADFSKAVNHIVPGLIRTNADELTYHFHIIIRYEIEKGLFEERFAVSDLPEIWESYYQEYLGIKPTSHVNGILQDVHWAHGSFGYFPTYSIGSLYAAQIEQKLIRDLSNFKSLISNGQFNPIHQWFSDNLYNLGRLHDSEALCEITTGEKLKPEYFLNYIKQKYSDLYNVKIKNLNNVLSP
jgi:carboxypeptidase Taq